MESERRPLPYAALLLVLLLLPVFAAAAPPLKPGEPIRVAIVGLVHGHVQGFLGELPKKLNATLVAIVEPDQALAHPYAARYHLDSKLFLPRVVSTYCMSQRHEQAIRMSLTHTGCLRHCERRGWRS